MQVYILGDLCCFTVPTILVILVILIIFMMAKKYKRFRVILAVSIILCSVIFSLTIYSSYKRYVECVPYDGWYEFQVYIEDTGKNESTIKTDIPLPHDSRIYSKLKFYTSYQEMVDWEFNYHEGQYKFDFQSQYLSYSINNSLYGKVLHIETNNSLFIYSIYNDFGNTINPDLRLSTQDKNVTYVKLSDEEPVNVSLIMYYVHTWPVGFGLSFHQKHQYLSISEEPFNLPNEFPDTSEYNKENIFMKDGAKLSSGWNQLRVTSDAYIVRD